MKINKVKTKTMKFTNSKNIDFSVEIEFSDGKLIENVEEMKLLGVVVSSDLKWTKNTTYICQKARTKLWILRRMAFLDLSVAEMFDVYAKEVRSILEYAAPVWHSSITHKQTSEIESIQKLAFRIILGNKYVRYSDACAVFKTETLERRRHTICLKFAQKNVKSEQSLFTLSNIDNRLRPRKNIVEEYTTQLASRKAASRFLPPSSMETELHLFLFIV